MDGSSPKSDYFFFWGEGILCFFCVVLFVHVSKKKIWIGWGLAYKSFSRIFEFFQLDKTPYNAEIYFV